MTIDEIADRIKNQRHLEQLEQKPATPYNPSDAMDNLEEAKQYIRFLYAQVQDYKETMKRMQDSLDEIKAELKVARESRVREQSKTDGKFCRPYRRTQRRKHQNTKTHATVRDQEQ